MITATEKGLTSCKVCHTLTDRPGEDCLICGRSTSLPDRRSLQTVWAFWFAGLAAYIPGNMLPITVTYLPSGELTSTILGGVTALIHHGSYGIAAIIFTASILVPVSKFAVVAWVSISIQRRKTSSKHNMQHAHEIVEVLGSWSMVDVFVVAALAALIQLGGVMRLAPGPAAQFFALSVVFTMLAARNLDTRLIWSDNRG